MSTLLTLKMLNEEAASSRNRPQDIMERLQIQEAHAVADIGSGGRYFTLEFAKKVGNRGKVYTIDTQSKNLDFIQHQWERQGLNNIALTLPTGNKLDLPDAGLDLVFVRKSSGMPR